MAEETKPTPSHLRDAVCISMSYASMILSEARKPPRPLAIEIYRKTGWKPSVLEGYSEDDIDQLERLEGKAA